MAAGRSDSMSDPGRVGSRGTPWRADTPATTILSSLDHHFSMATDKHYHLFEFHMHGEGIQFGPRSLGGGGGEAEESVEETETASTGNESGSGRAKLGLAALLGLGLLAAVAVGVKRLAGGEASLEDIEVLDESESEPETVEA